MMTYIDDLKKELSKYSLNQQEQDEILADFKEMLNTAIQEGLDPKDIAKKFGTAKKVAEEIAQDQGAFEKKSTDSEDDGSFRLWKSFQPTEEKMNMTIKLINEDVMIKPSLDQAIHVHVKGAFNPERYELIINANELSLSTPTLKGFRFKHLFSSHSRVKFLIEVPEELMFKQATVSVINAYLHMNGVRSEQFTISTTNGDVLLEQASLGTFKINSVNGDIEANNVYVDLMQASSVSGDMLFQSCVFNKEIKLNSVSGDFEINGSTCIELDMSTVSGDLIGNEFYPKRIHFKSLSGDITLKNSDNQPIEIHKKGPLSGSVDIEF